MTTNEHDPTSDDEVPYSRWEDFKERLHTSWRRDDFSRHTIYWCIVVWVGFLCYALIVRLGEALGLVG
ncbi:hypothetical protein [Dietzia sp. PP-33]|uniref:hypothetical protein n=1 Tax=Dietzia sp. PP-33 TaxID=2957500 RepID=UPI0029BDBCAD|nr:hypothetical protein [Dietzia sp. PP-33]MDX2358886.1 hypothetical protein [Dietzia sp. PP-33]